MPRAGSFSLYGSPLAELTLAVFMFLGAVSVIWVKALVERNWNIMSRTNEPGRIALAILVLGVYFYRGHSCKTSSPGCYRLFTV